MSAKIIAAICAAVAFGCQGPVHDLESGSAPLVTIHGRIETSTVLRYHHLRAGILWLGVPVFVPYCFERGRTPLDPDRTISEVAANACRDPFEVVPSFAGPSADIDLSTGKFEIPIAHLPDAAILVGTPAARVGYASLIVYDDQNDDGVLNFNNRCGRGPSSDGDDMFRFGNEPILASSFSRLTAAQTRITYVEGPFDADSFFYPHPDCEALPPQGFSIWNVSDLLHRPGTCSVQAIDEEISIATESATALNDLSCPQADRESFPRPPPERLPGNNVLSECVRGYGLVVSDPRCTCTNLRIYSLRGCYSDDACSTPDWDLKPPRDWPCTF